MNIIVTNKNSQHFDCGSHRIARMARLLARMARWLADNFTNKANSHTSKVEILTRSKLCHFVDRYVLRAKLFFNKNKLNKNIKAEIARKIRTI